MAACIFARKLEWIRSACLAAALLFPAVAALHGIVLATLHRNGKLLVVAAVVRLEERIFLAFFRQCLTIWQAPLIWMSMALSNYARLGSLRHQ